MAKRTEDHRDTRATADNANVVFIACGQKGMKTVCLVLGTLYANEQVSKWVDKSRLNLLTNCLYDIIRAHT